jgi:hypothetical protein
MMYIVCQDLQNCHHCFIGKVVTCLTSLINIFQYQSVCWYLQYHSVRTLILTISLGENVDTYNITRWECWYLQYHSVRTLILTISLGENVDTYNITRWERWYLQYHSVRMLILTISLGENKGNMSKFVR